MIHLALLPSVEDHPALTPCQARTLRNGYMHTEPYILSLNNASHPLQRSVSTHRQNNTPMCLRIIRTAAGMQNKPVRFHIHEGAHSMCRYHELATMFGSPSQACCGGVSCPRNLPVFEYD